MRLEDSRRSDNVEDRRGMGARGGIKLGGAGILIVLVLSLVTGRSPLELLPLLGGGGSEGQAVPAAAPDPGDRAADFVAAVLGETEDAWGELFRQAGRAYEPATLVLFTDAVSSACGYAGAAVGPFYCPPDRKVYIDLSFWNELGARFGAPGDFAQAYVIAHEIGHHVQNLLGVAEEVDRARRRMSERDANALSVRQELQADCFAGVWAYHAHARRAILESGDVEEGLSAAAAIGDDRLQRQAQGYIVPESFTHGTSEQRVRWFRRGLDQGTVAACDTFRGS